MNDDLRQQIYNNMALKETGDLLNIWQTNDHVEWSETAFEVIQKLLIYRLGEIPKQNTPITEHEEPIKKQVKIENTFPVSKSLRISSISLVVLLTLFISVLASKNNWSNHPILEHLFSLGLGVHLSVIGFVYTYYAWRLNAKEYIKWHQAQHMFRNEREQSIISDSKTWHFWSVVYNWYSLYYLWSNRLGSLFAILVGMGFSGFALFSILNLFLE